MINNDASSVDHNSAEYWSQRYQSGDNPWDLGNESAVFSSLRRSHPDFSVHAGQHLSLLVPGCGFGHDAVAFAQAGFEVTALDFAEEPLLYLQEHCASVGVQLRTLQRDVFTLSWDMPSSFDRIIEYTCYCAIDPSRRQEYITTLAEVLKPGGIMAGLFFPMDELERTAPPFTVHEDEIRHQCELAGLVPMSSELPRESHPARAGRERLMIFRKNV